VRATKLARPKPLGHCRQTTIDALITEALSQLEVEATRDYIRAQNVLRACDGDLTAAYALLGYWMETK
jgi:hypothetical protein